MRKLLSCVALLLGMMLASAQEQKTNIPTIHISTGGVPITSKTDYVPATVTIVCDGSEYEVTDLPAGIRGRGNSTWGFEKKPYRIKFDKKINLFGLPAKAKSWVLLANHCDKSLLRNAMAFEISRVLGFEFSPSTVFADVVLNGSYVGSYMVTDQMEVNKGRVNIDEMDETCTSGEELTGGYLLELDGWATSEPVWFQTPKGIMVTVKSPDDDIITPGQLQYITRFINDFETALFSADFKDPEKGYRAKVDTKSLVDWYIACELTGNSDSFWSTYCYKKRSDDHLYFGPLWDYDIAFNNDFRLGDAVNKLMRESAHNPKQWVQRMWQDPWMRHAVYTRWNELVQAGLEEHLLSYLDECAQLIAPSAKLNFDRWHILNKQVYRELYNFPTWEGNVDYLRQYIHARIEFLTASFYASDDIETSLEYAGGSYAICHSSGLYLGFGGDHARIYTEPAEITFVQCGVEGVYNLVSADGRMLRSDTGWSTSYTDDANDPYAQFSVEKSTFPGYVRIKNLGRGKYLGVDNQTDGSEVYTDKSGNNMRHAWTIAPAAHDALPTLPIDAAAPIEIYTLSGAKANPAHLAPGLYIMRQGSGAAAKLLIP